MSKKILSLAVAIMAGLIFCAGPALAKAKPIELSLSLIIPPGHLRYITSLKPWIDQVQERTGGKVKITPFFSCALGPPNQTFDSAAAGVTDLAEGIIYATPGRFPLTETVMLPDLGFKNANQISHALWKCYQTIPELREEWKGVKLLWLVSGPCSKIITSKKPVRTLEELKGLKIRVSGYTAAKVGKALGFTPVSMPMGDLYLGLEKGVIDGVALPDELLISRRLGEVTKYMTRIELGYDTFFMVVNQKVWDKLPDDVKKVFEELSGEWAVDMVSRNWDKFDAEVAEKMDAQGFTHINLSPEEEARWRERLAPIKYEYAEELETKGLAGKKVLNALLEQAKN